MWVSIAKVRNFCRVGNIRARYFHDPSHYLLLINTPIFSIMRCLFTIAEYNSRDDGIKITVQIMVS